MQKRTKLILVLFLGIQLVVIAIIKNYPYLVEDIYSNGLYPYISKLMRYTFGWLPFSAGDIFYTIGSVVLIRWFIVNRKKIIKEPLDWLLNLVAGFSVIYFAFHFLWGYNYYRPPLYQSLNIDAEYSTEDLLDFTLKLIEKSNFYQSALANSDSLKVDFPYSKSEIFEMTNVGYDKLNSTYPNWEYGPKSLKKSIYSLPLTYMGFSGYLNPFTNEAQVDGLIPTYKFPVTSCHEMAHQLGYAAENEANFIGCLAAINHEDKYFKYSGYTFALRYCLSELYQRNKELYYDILPKVNKGILANYEEVSAFWRAYENPLEPFFHSTFDNFLKANNQSDGMKSYNYVVGLLVNFFKSNTL